MDAKQCTDNCDMRKVKNCFVQIIAGYKKDILERALSAKISWNKHTPQGAQYNEWMAIGKLICEWTCARKSIRV